MCPFSTLSQRCDFVKTHKWLSAKSDNSFPAGPRCPRKDVNFITHSIANTLEYSELLIQLQCVARSFCDLNMYFGVV